MARLDEHDGVLGDLAASARLLTDGEVACVVGSETAVGLSPRQRKDLQRKLNILYWWRACRRALRLPRGGCGPMVRSFCRAAEARFGRRVSARTLERWQIQYRVGGGRRLVDRRGLRLREPLDPACLTVFAELVARGESKLRAHRRVLEAAEARGLVWPRGLPTVLRWLKRDEGRPSFRVHMGGVA